MTVSLSGTVTFRYDYRLHGHRETLTGGADHTYGACIPRLKHVAAYRGMGRCPRQGASR